MAIKPLELNDGSVIYVEVDDEAGQITEYLPTSDNSGFSSNVPPGIEPTSALDNWVIGGKLLQETISNAAQNVRDSLKEMQPDEWSVELNVGFQSTDKGLISYLGKGSGGLKVKATWKKPVT